MADFSGRNFNRSGLQSHKTLSSIDLIVHSFPALPPLIQTFLIHFVLYCHYSCQLHYVGFCSCCLKRSNIYEPSGTCISCLLALCHKFFLQPLFLLYLPHCEFMNFCLAIPNHCSRSASVICQSDAISRCRYVVLCFISTDTLKSIIQPQEAQRGSFTETVQFNQTIDHNTQTERILRSPMFLKLHCKLHSLAIQTLEQRQKMSIRVSLRTSTMLEYHMSGACDWEWHLGI